MESQASSWPSTAPELEQWTQFRHAAQGLRDALDSLLEARDLRLGEGHLLDVVAHRQVGEDAFQVDVRAFLLDEARERGRLLHGDADAPHARVHLQVHPRLEAESLAHRLERLDVGPLPTARVMPFSTAACISSGKAWDSFRMGRRTPPFRSSMPSGTVGDAEPVRHAGALGHERDLDRAVAVAVGLHGDEHLPAGAYGLADPFDVLADVS